MRADPTFPGFVARSMALAIALGAAAFCIAGAITWITSELIHFLKH